MKNIKLLFTYSVFVLSFSCLQSLFAQTALQVYNGKVKKNLKDSIEIEYYSVKNKNLILIINSVINEWEKSICYEPEYNFRIYTYPLIKNSDIIAQEDDNNNSKKDIYWLIEIEPYWRRNLVEDILDWGCFLYKKRLFILAGHPCKELFYFQEKKVRFPYNPGKDRGDYEAFVTIASWSYKYSDKHFIATERKVCK